MPSATTAPTKTQVNRTLARRRNRRFKTNDQTAKVIVENYSNYDEDGRLKTPYGILEEEHTREMILSEIGSAKNSRVLDIGGGSGPYSFWLAAQGHEVHLSDIVPRHIQLAQDNKNSNSLASIQLEDARQLSYKDNYADFIVLNGPLYHLVHKSDRLKVLHECYRVLRPNGVLMAFAIGRTSGLMYSLNSGAIFLDDYFTMVKHEIITGVRNNYEGKNKTFLEAYFHNSKEINSEMMSCRFEVKRTKGVLGQAWNIQSLEDSILDIKKRRRLMEVARLMEEMPDFSPKILVVGVKSAG